MSDSLKIGLLTPGWPGHNTPNGIATAVYHLTMGLKMAGHHPIIVAANIDGSPPADIPYIQIIDRPWTIFQKIRSRLGFADTSLSITGESLGDAFAEEKARHGLDAIIMEETLGWSHWVIRRKIAPVAVFLHGPWLLHKSIQSDGAPKADSAREKHEARAMRAAAALISPSKNVLDAVEAAVDVANLPRRVIANSYLPRQTVPEQLENNQILFVGRFDYHKGGDTVVEAFRILHAENADIHLTFAGPDLGLRQQGGQKISLPEFLKPFPEKTRNAIAVLGRQTSEDLAELRESHPIAVIASRYETFGYTVLEAMAAGQAIVSTNVGGPAEVLEDNKTALLVPPGNPSAMAEALKRLMEYPALRHRLGSAAKVHLEAYFHPETIAADIVQFLQPVLNGDTEEK